MFNFHYSLGLDIGIGSVGWAILQNNPEGEPIRIQDLGVRIFEKAETVDGASLAASRREARGVRRRIRRHRHRLERIRYLLEQSNVMTVKAIEEMYANESFKTSPYQLRAEALSRCLTKEESVRVLIHIAQRRGYQVNSSAEEAKDMKEAGKVKTAITENRQRMEQNGYRTIGEMMYLDPCFWLEQKDGTKYHQVRNKSNDYHCTVERSAIVEEIQMIFAMQRSFGVDWMDEALEKAYLDIFSGQRSFDEGPGGDSPYRGGIAANVGFSTLPVGSKELRATKASYSFEYFKLWQDLNHMRIASPTEATRPLSMDEKEILKTAAFKSSSLTYAQIRKKLSLPDNAYFNNLYYGGKSREEVEKKQKWTQMQSFHKLRKALDQFKKDTIQTLTETQLNDIATILALHKSDHERIEQLRKAGIPAEFDEFLLPLSFTKFGKLSITALQKLTPYLEQGMRYDEACAEVYGDHRVVNNGQRKNRLSMKDLDDDITNPVARRAVSQCIKVINAIVRTYGPPDVVRVELAREMSHNYDKRMKIESLQEQNHKRNEQIKAQIAEYKYKYKTDRVTGLDIVKFKLFQEQDGVCLYSGKNLELSELFKPGYVDVDHIIPYSRCFDDSYANKVLVLTEENRQKGNRLPYEYFGQDAERWQAYEARVSKIHHYRKRQKLLKTHLTPEESNAFIARNLKDTQYISKTVYNLIRQNLQFNNSKYNQNNAAPVQAVNGAITAMLRSRWGIQKIRADGDLHHCRDAVVIAATSPGLVQRITEYYNRKERFEKAPAGFVDPSTGELVEATDHALADRIPEPWLKFRQELEARLSKNPREQIDWLKLATYSNEEEIKPVFVSCKPNHKITGPAHKETIRSGKAGDEMVVSKVPLEKLKLNKKGEIIFGNAQYYNRSSDELLYQALVDRLKQFDGNGVKAFAEPFYKPKHDGTPGPRVKAVKMIEKSTLTVPLKCGVAANDSMVRIDVFKVEDDGYYFIPIYVADTVKPTLPQKAVVASKAYKQWKEMDDKNFIFSLYPGDLVYIYKQSGIKLNIAKEGTGEQEMICQDGMYYYRSADISKGSIKISTHDRRYFQKSLGLKTLNTIEKYQVDILGNYHKVQLPEKRMIFQKKKKG